jgi:hypothetical protein
VGFARHLNKLSGCAFRFGNTAEASSKENELQIPQCSTLLTEFNATQIFYDNATMEAQLWCQINVTHSLHLMEE